MIVRDKHLVRTIEIELSTIQNFNKMIENVKRRYITTYKPNGLDEISRPGSGSWPAK
jgi:hypothetical protein